MVRTARHSCPGVPFFRDRKLFVASALLALLAGHVRHLHLGESGGSAVTMDAVDPGVLGGAAISDVVAEALGTIFGVGVDR